MIDRNDYIVKKGRKFFRISCPICGQDKGYKNPESQNRPCYSCNGKKANKASLKTRSGKICSVKGCGLQHKANGWCETHYEQHRRPKGIPNTNCLTCGVPLAAISAHQKYCSDRCCGKAYRIKNPQKIKAAHDQYKQNHKEIVAKRCKEWTAKNLEYVVAYRKQKRFENREKNRQYWKDRRANDPMFRLKNNLRNRLNAILQNKSNFSCTKLVGCDWDHLKRYLEAHFVEGMSWENYGQWHLDHIMPLASFDLSDEAQLKKACHYTNLQPLWAIDNLKKGDKIL